MPLFSLAVEPGAAAGLSFNRCMGTFAMLLSGHPTTVVFLAIDPTVCANSMLHIILKPALVGASICPDQSSFAVHFIFKPLSLIDSAISPPIDAFALNFIATPMASVHRPIRPYVGSLTVFLAPSV